MGGGGGSYPSLGDIQSLVNKAKQELKESEKSGRRNVFISFAYEDLNEVNLLRGQAKNDNIPLEFNDWSISEPIDSERAPYIKQKISERISQSSVTVVYLSEQTSKSNWVSWEIQESLRQGKCVIGVYSKGGMPKKLPKEFSQQKLKSVQWSDLAETIANL